MMKVAIIGAGPSGLVTLKYLTEYGSQAHHGRIEAKLFESAAQIGGTFAARAYDDAELVSSRQLTTFSDFRCLSAEDFLSAKAYVQYLDDYCCHFGLWPHIHLLSTVTRIKRRVKGHSVIFQNGNGQFRWDCDAIAICSGLHVKPNRPTIPGFENVPSIIHSSEFKSKEQFKDCRTVMIVGAGETGADIAYLAANSPGVVKVVLCHKDGVHFAPKRNPGPDLLPFLTRRRASQKPAIPIDVSRANVFDTAYVHQVLRTYDYLLWAFYRIYIKVLLFLSTGTTAGFDQWIGEISPERDDPSKIFFNKSSSACHNLSNPYRPRQNELRYWLLRLKSIIVATALPKCTGIDIDLAPLPKCIGDDGTIEFVDNRRLEFSRMSRQQVRPDLIILCTGYAQEFPFFKDDEKSETYPRPVDADMRQIWRRDDPTVGFMGFVRPSLGAIPPLAEMQAQLWILNLLAPQNIKSSLSRREEEHYRLKHEQEARIKYGVDHESYAYQLAMDMGSAPGLTDIVKLSYSIAFSQKWRLLLIWALGANFNTKFRLIGPWKLEGAEELLTSEEFWQTITRRPFLFGENFPLLKFGPSKYGYPHSHNCTGHIATSVLPISIFGPLSLLCWLCSTFFGAVAIGMTMCTR